MWYFCCYCHYAAVAAAATTTTTTTTATAAATTAAAVTVAAIIATTAATASAAVFAGQFLGRWNEVLWVAPVEEKAYDSTDYFWFLDNAVSNGTIRGYETGRYEGWSNNLGSPDPGVHMRLLAGLRTRARELARARVCVCVFVSVCM